MTFYKIGDWIPIEDKPENNNDKYYVMTALFDCCAKHSQNSYRLVMGSFFTFCENEWKFYSNGKWNSDLNPNYKPIAYAEVREAEPYQG